MQLMRDIKISSPPCHDRLACQRYSVVVLLVLLRSLWENCRGVISSSLSNPMKKIATLWPNISSVTHFYAPKRGESHFNLYVIITFCYVFIPILWESAIVAVICHIRRSNRCRRRTQGHHFSTESATTKKRKIRGKIKISSQ
jgi:hypothetical protein